MTAVTYVDSAGKLIATYLGAHTPPVGGAPVATAPEDARQRWDGSGWGEVVIVDEAERLEINNARYEAATLAITASYPQLEKDTWPTQDKESKAWLADPDNALTPWIDRAALTRGIDREEYLRRTLAKAQQFEMVSSYLTGTRQKYEDQIKAGGDPVLDYAIPPSLYAEMQAKALLIMTAPTVDLKEHL